MQSVRLSICSNAGEEAINHCLQTNIDIDEGIAPHVVTSCYPLMSAVTRLHDEPFPCVLSFTDSVTSAVVSGTFYEYFQKSST